ncbi:5-dehydro-4-deoxyglucarate dehydratase [Streptomyces sp. TRM 70361]|uniref:5-dehydro-4-deoxyglucarate dehydratase n=1 Tax=Streptomyces sp. TRM 70361 TaxID=3116553 RepID=UPI002E7C150C|nr:5-dehydro-4-deoxyglucarate dehydratase [Streptomyces sp. TRM 70361]MEE1938936.1 5-dehydro-4-deoxyglucarate dehydratase [Streptomyces sp. TRM 70361]
MDAPDTLTAPRGNTRTDTAGRPAREGGERRLDGLLFFPVTPFAPGGEVDEDLLARHIDDGVKAGAGAVFVACGTGEFPALSLEEIEACTRVAVAATAGRVPVYAAAGGPLPIARSQARCAERVGADGLLLLPPYLVSSPPQGLLRYVEEVAAASALPVIVYQRANAVLTPHSAAELTRLPGVIGIKDGLGDMELMHRIVRAVRREAGEDFLFFNGLPTAEMTMHAYRAMGVPLYSSAAFAFAPEVALDFHRAFTGGDDARARLLLDEFFVPLVTLRNEVPGYAVSLVKAGVRMRGLPVGGVRAPLMDPTPAHLDRLEKLVDHGLRLVTA